MKFLAAIACCLLPAACCFSQLPDTDIWLLNMQETGGKFVFAKPVNITDRPGYDNQPVFSPDGKYICFSSLRDSAMKQTDIYKYHIKTKITTPFTRTPASEYSPAFMPDGQNISVVMVEKDSAQRLWKFPLKEAGNPSLITDVDSVGYYCWMSKDSIAFFILTSPFSLQVVNIHTAAPVVIAKNIGRSIQRVPSMTTGKWENVWMYLEKISDKDWKMKSFYYGKKSKIITAPMCPTCATLPGVEDFAMSRGKIIIADGSKLYAFDDYDYSWDEIADLNNFNIHNIKRIAISPDGKKIALVTAK